MDKRIAGLLGAAAALAMINPGHAATPAQQTEVAPAANYKDLLNPVPNALAVLKSDDERRAATPSSGGLKVAAHHHHHHHHHHKRRHHHHHHHHHHM
jgi:hypothetical protein